MVYDTMCLCGGDVGGDLLGGDLIVGVCVMCVCGVGGQLGRRV